MKCKWAGLSWDSQIYLIVSYHLQSSLDAEASHSDSMFQTPVALEFKSGAISKCTAINQASHGRCMVRDFIERF